MSRIYIIFLAGILACNFFLLSAYAVSAGDSKFIEGLKKTAAETGGAGYSDVNPMNYISGIVGKSLTPMFIGVTFLGIMIYAGFTWMMARGNEQEVERAKNIIIYAVIGLVVVLAAYAIVKIILPIWGLVIVK